MRITWYGHSCFLLEAAGQPRLLTDPCDPETGYALRDIEAEIVTVSHEHHDHNYLGAVKGEPIVLRGAGERRFDEIRVSGIPSWHDDSKGALRGANMMFLIEMEGLRTLHLGDLGHMPDTDAIQAIGAVDVMLTPIGGTYTIDAAKARQVFDALAPRVLIPMHYRTDSLAIQLEGLDPFLLAARDLGVHRLNEATCTLSRETLGEARVIALDYKRL